MGMGFWNSFHFPVILIFQRSPAPNPKNCDVLLVDSSSEHARWKGRSRTREAPDLMLPGSEEGGER